MGGMQQPSPKLRWFALAALAATLGCAGCAAREAEAAHPFARSGVHANGDGTFRVHGRGRLDPREALNDAMNRANTLAREEGRLMAPLRIEPGEATDSLGKPVFTCALTFRLQPLPASASPHPGDHSFAAFEHRMRLLVEAGVLTIEEYTRLMASHPGAREASLRAGEGALEAAAPR